MSATPPLPNDAPGNIPTYMVWSILSTIGSVIICCLSCVSFPAIITGVVAIVFSSQVNGKLNRGDIAGAQQASRNAKIWNWVTTGIIIFAIVATIIWFVAVGPEAYLEYMEEFRQQMEQAS